jgi:hypothetical protein
MGVKMNADDTTLRVLDWIWGGLITIGGYLWGHTMGVIRDHKKETREDLAELRKAREQDTVLLADNMKSLMVMINTHAERSEQRHIEIIKALSTKQDIIR